MTVYNILQNDKIENVGGEAQKFVARIKKAIEANNPGYVIMCEVQKSLGHKYIRIATTLRNEWYNGYAQNDKAYQTFFIWGVRDDDSLEEKVRVELNLGGKLHVKPAPGSRYCDAVKFGWRNKTGTPDQVVKHFETYFKKVKKVVEENQDRIPF